MKRTLKTLSLSMVVCTALFLSVTPATAQDQLLSAEQVTYYTLEWQGPRDTMGRPMVSDDLLNRLKFVRLEEAWGAIRGAGYNNKFDGDYHVMHPERTMVGRALTATFMPMSPELNERMIANARAKGIPSGANLWPIYLLKPGDVYVADGWGKVENGTLIGNNLGTAIFANSGNGPVFNAGARDLDALRDLEGFNAWVKGWHPSAIQDMMLVSINGPTRMGAAIALPGDVVLATEGGVLFIPPHLLERVVLSSEVERLSDNFRKERLGQGKYVLGQMYGVAWSDEINNDFYGWLRSERARINSDFGVGFSTIDKVLETRSTNWREW